MTAAAAAAARGMAAVELYIYDLTRGLARQFAPALIGRPLDGIWYGLRPLFLSLSPCPTVAQSA